MNTTTLSAARERRKADRVMKSRTDGISYQEGGHAHIKHTRERGRITVTVGGVGYLLRDGTNESELFAAYVEKDAYYIELVTPEDTTDFRLDTLIEQGEMTDIRQARGEQSFHECGL
jgi:hypothetical protein